MAGSAHGKQEKYLADFRKHPVSVNRIYAMPEFFLLNRCHNGAEMAGFGVWHLEDRRLSGGRFAQKDILAEGIFFAELLRREA